MNDTDMKLPKVLIVSGAPLDETKGLSSTLVNFFEHYDPDRLAQVYFGSGLPNTTLCTKFFQISEMAQLKKLLLWNTTVGRVVSACDIEGPLDYNDIKTEQKIGDFVRSHRSVFFYYAREILWSMGFWKNKRLNAFIKDFKPDVIWFESYPLPFMHKLCMHIAKVAKTPSVIFLQDDVFTYKSVGSTIGYINRFFLRQVVKHSIRSCVGHFVASPKMKKEYDLIFGINSIFVTKGIDIRELPEICHNVKKTIRIVYMGNIIYGRISTLLELAKSIDNLNKNGLKFELNIYTTNYISSSDLAILNASCGVNLCKPVSYTEVPIVMKAHDVVLILESFDNKFKNIARLSFSTKITDCLASGKCILAIGPLEIAPMEYLRDTDSAIVINSSDDIKSVLYKLKPSVIVEYAEKARECALSRHSKDIMDNNIYSELMRVASTAEINNCNFCSY